MEEDKRSYIDLLVKEDVQVKVPKEGPYMSHNDAHSFEIGGKTVMVPAHWRNGLLLKNDTKSVILNRLFYGISRQDLGKKINATVKVIEKTTKDGEVFKMLDIFKTPGTSIREIKYTENGNGIPVPPTKIRINFKPL